MEKKLLEAQFNPKVKTYWLLSGVLVCVLTIVGIPLLLIWIPLGLLLTGRYLDAMSCVLTEKNLKVSKGVLNRVEKTVPLDKITDVALRQGPIMRVLDLEALSVETAGQSSQGALVMLVGVENARNFRDSVLAQRDKVYESEIETAPEGAASHEKVQEPVLLEIRDALLRIEKALCKSPGD